MPRTRTQKQVAKRIDIWYFRHPSHMRKVRRVLIVGCALVAAIWIAIGAFGHRTEHGSWLDPVSLTMMHNPGRVAHVHAFFETKCEECHTGEKPGQYTRNVTDTACLKCHDGAIHDQHQFITDDPTKVSRRSLTLAVNDSSHPVVPQRSAGCIECHTEHKGESKLLGGNNENCVVCHADLNKARTVNSSNFNSVTAFETGNHPDFGIALKTDSNTLSDPPKVKFNHKYHFTSYAALETACTACHTNQIAQSAPSVPYGTSAPGVPPFQAGNDEEIAAAKTTQGPYMHPIRYAAHCANCHPLKLNDTLTVPHTDLTTIGALLPSLKDQIVAQLNAMSPDDQKAKLTITESKGRKKTTREITPDEYVTGQLAALKQAVSDWASTPAFTKADEKHLPKAFKDAITERVGNSDPPDQLVLLTYVAYVMQDNCAKCHDMHVTAEKPRRGSHAPAALPTLATESTGLEAPVKRWYTNSMFDHRAHRDMSCLECHSKALISGPDQIVNTTFARETGAADLLLPNVDACVRCHKPGGEAAGAATGACISCHVYHDRTKERPAGTEATPPTTQPSVASAGAPTG